MRGSRRRRRSRQCRPRGCAAEPASRPGSRSAPALLRAPVRANTTPRTAHDRSARRRRARRRRPATAPASAAMASPAARRAGHHSTMPSAIVPREPRPGRAHARDRPGQREFRCAVLAEHAPIAADRAFERALPRLVERLDDVVVEAALMRVGEEPADEAGLLHQARAARARAACRRRDSRSRRYRWSCPASPPRPCAGWHRCA